MDAKVVDIDDVDDAEVLGETKAERFRRVAGPRVRATVKRLRMLRQMVDGSNANNYEFTDDQRAALINGLLKEVNDIDLLMRRRLVEDDDLPTFI